MKATIIVNDTSVTITANTPTGCLVAIANATGWATEAMHYRPEDGIVYHHGRAIGVIHNYPPDETSTAHADNVTIFYRPYHDDPWRFYGVIRRDFLASCRANLLDMEHYFIVNDHTGKQIDEG